MFALQRKRGGPPGTQSAKSKMEQKTALVKQRLALLDSASSSSSSSSAEIDKDDDFVPMVRTCVQRFSIDFILLLFLSSY